jgi:dienelactone hydrolase
MRRHVVKTVFLFATLVGLGSSISRGQIYDYMTGAVGTRMWVPPGLHTVKGILIWGNGAGADERNAAYAPWLEDFAQLHGFALIGTSMWGNLAGTEINTWDTHIAALAAQSGHPELKNAPYAPIGFSNGGQMSYGFNALRPEKTIAFVTNKGCCYNITSPSAAALKTPGVLIAGALDTDVRRNSIKSLFDNNRARGALWSWVEQQGVAHAGTDEELMLPFMDEAIRLRYPANQAPTATAGVTLLDVNPTNGWLADQSTWHTSATQVSPYGQYPGNKQTAGWLLDDNIAYAYRAFSTYDHQATLSFLNQPYPGLMPRTISFGISGSDVQLRLDLTALPGWTKVELFNDAHLLEQLSPSGSTQNILNLDVPNLGSGVYGLSALVTGADGHTLSTTNLLVYTAVPEPSAIWMSIIAACVTGVSLRSNTRRNSQQCFLSVFRGLHRKLGAPRRY